MNDYYVYLHRRLTDNSVFYVGKGRLNRASSKSGRSERWKREVAKYGIIIDIVFDNLSEDEAFQCEVDTIIEQRYFGSKLANFTNGGEGTSGYRFSAAQKEQMSLSRKGRIKSEEHRRNMSLSQIGKKRPAEQIEKMRKSLTGKVQSEETKAKRSQTLKLVGTSNDPHSYVFFSSDDVFIGTRKEFSEYVGIHSSCFRNLFCNPPAKSQKGWSVLNLNKLLILKETLNGYNCL